MSNFTARVPFEIEFDGDVVTGNIKRASISDMKAISPFIKKQKGDKVIMSFEETVEVAEIAAGILPDKVTDFKGLKDADGNAITIQQVCDEAYFLPILMHIFKVMNESSSIKKVDEKKLENTSVDAQTEQTGEVHLPLEQLG